MEKLKAFLKRKNIVISAKRYGIDALGAMAQGLFCSLLIGTIINTIGTQFHIPFLTQVVATLGSGDHTISYTVGGVIYMIKKPNFSEMFGFHELFHIFVLLGSLFHFLMIFFYVS